MRLPEDCAMLLSFVNTKLRYEYPTLDAFCGDAEIPREQLEEKLEKFGYVYDGEKNRFL